jgi:hypothetical protein
MKSQTTISLIALLLISTFGLIYSSVVVADLRRGRPTEIDTSGVRIVLGPAETFALGSTTREKYLREARQVVAQRLHQLQLAGDYDVAVDRGQLEVALPDSENIAYIVNIISRVGQIEFIDGGGSPPIGQKVKTGPNTVFDQNMYRTLFTGWEIAEIIPPNTDTGQIFYQIIPNPVAAERVSDFVDPSATQYICLVIDKEVVNCSKMYAWSGHTLDILPNLSSGADVSLADLAVFLKSGPLPISLKVVTD